MISKLDRWNRLIWINRMELLRDGPERKNDSREIKKGWDLAANRVL